MVGMTVFTGTVVGLQGYAALDQIGTAAFSGFASAYINTREVAPLVAGLALSATVGAGFTAQLGAMRISEEIDALEVMGVPSLPFLVTTRIIAGFIAVIPLYIIGLLSQLPRVADRSSSTSTGSRRAPTTTTSTCSYRPQDVFWSFGKVLIFAVVIILVHCYYGYRATGGPAGVGVAVGRSVQNDDRDRGAAELLHRLRHLGHHGDGEDRRMRHGTWATVRRRLLGIGFIVRGRGAGEPVDRHVQQGVHAGGQGQR